MDRKTKIFILLSLLGFGVIFVALLAPDMHVWKQNREYMAGKR